MRRVSVCLCLLTLIGCNRRPPAEPPAEPVVSTAPPLVGPAQPAPAPDKGVEPRWARLSEPLTLGAVRVTVLQVGRGTVELQRDGKGKTMPDAAESLWVRLRIDNLSGVKVLGYSSWARPSPPPATLTDEFGNTYRPRDNDNFPPVGGVSLADVRPGESVTDVLRFELPAHAAKRFRLELRHPDAEAKAEPFRFEFDRAAVDKPKEPATLTPDKK